MTSIRRPLVYLLALCLGSASCNSQRNSNLDRVPAASPASPIDTTTAPSADIAPPSVAATRPSDYPGLHNVVAFAPNVYSGSVPEGDEGFVSLRRMGIRTVLSVDGAEPELEVAIRHGLRYVHLPISYSGVSDQRRLELAKAIRDLPKPIYVHCHHGKHRSAGAAGSALVSLGWLKPDEGVARMKVSGTSPEYKGLYACTAEAAAVLPAVLDALDVDLPAVVRPEGLVKTMVEIDIATENLKAIQKAGWKAPATHPDLAPASEAGRLADYYRYLHAAPDTAMRPEEYRQLMQESNRVASELEELLLRPATTRQELDASFSAVLKSCKQCHAKYRDQ